jgi:hypothetical protein
MQLQGSCHCGKVRFEVESLHFIPYQYCYCSICRKTQGGGGYAINLGADARTLKVHGRAHIKIYHAKIKNPEDTKAIQSSGERHFCQECGTGLWLYDPEWPDLVHPFASAVDTSLPVAPEHTHIMLEFKAPWVEVPTHLKDRKFQRYPRESIAGWHERLGLVDEVSSRELHSP